MRHAAHIFGAALLWLAIDASTAPRAAAQSAPPAAEGAIAGRVLDSDRAPVVDATVEVVSIATVRTDSAGEFRVEHLPAGALMIRVTRLGFAPALTMIALHSGEERPLTITLAPSARDLDRVVVRADSESRLLDDPTGFDRRRRARNGGTFLVADDIERRHPLATEELFRGIPGVYVDTAGILSTSRGKISLRDYYLPPTQNDQFHTCIGMEVFVDGVAMPQPFDINEVAPSRIRAIEVYRGPATTPPELRSAKSVCGTVAVWTKSG